MDCHQPRRVASRWHQPHGRDFESDTTRPLKNTGNAVLLAIWSCFAWNCLTAAGEITQLGYQVCPVRSLEPCSREVCRFEPPDRMRSRKQVATHLRASTTASSEFGSFTCGSTSLTSLSAYNARRQLQAARNRRMGNHARTEGAPTDSCTPWLCPVARQLPCDQTAIPT